MGYNSRVEKYEVGYESEDYSLLVALSMSLRRGISFGGRRNSRKSI